MRTIRFLIVMLASCQAAQPEPPSTKSQAVEGFPLPVPIGAEIREVRTATTALKPRHVDAELEARVTGDFEAIVAFFTAELTVRGLTVERSDHTRVDEGPESHEKLVRKQAQLTRLVGRKGDTQVHVVITEAREAHKLQIAIAGPL